MGWDLSIIASPRLRRIAEDAARRLDAVRPLRLHYAAVLLAGTITEAVLHDMIDAHGGGIDGAWTMKDYLRVAAELGIIDDATKRSIPLPLLSFRHMIHVDADAGPDLLLDERATDSSLTWLERLLSSLRARLAFAA
jgi:hypothetical protein